MPIHTSSNMNQKDKGLTVGELTMAIGALIIAGLIWSSFKNSKEVETSNLNALDVGSEEVLTSSKRS